MKKNLKCIRCGQPANIVLHGTSYCPRCARLGLNSQSVKLLPTSPLERVPKGDALAQAATNVTNTFLANQPWTYRMTATVPRNRMERRAMAKNQAQRLKAKRRNARRRGIRKAMGKK